MGVHVLKISIGILCGGKSKRFGSEKIFYKLHDKTILETIFEKFHYVTNDIFLQISNHQYTIKDLYKLTDNIHNDLTVEKGPLGGIYSAIVHAKFNKVFIVAGDLPFVDTNILVELNKFDDYQLVVPRWENGFLEPLCGLYSKDILPIIKSQLDKNDLKISNLFQIIDTKKQKTHRIKYLTVEKLVLKNSINSNCFKNINTLDDLKCLDV